MKKLDMVVIYSFFLKFEIKMTYMYLLFLELLAFRKDVVRYCLGTLRVAVLRQSKDLKRRTHLRPLTYMA